MIGTRNESFKGDRPDPKAGRDAVWFLGVAIHVKIQLSVAVTVQEHFPTWQEQGEHGNFRS